jgi:predicted DNA-binding transcriptional regulator YafY
MKTSRLIALILLLESHKLIKAKELAQILETSVRTIYRDIEVLCEAGIPIYATTGPNGGISLVEGYKTQLGRLTSDEIVNLYYTGIGLPADFTKSSAKLKGILIKLEAELPYEYKNDVRVAQQRFYYDNTPWWDEAVYAECIQLLRRAVINTTAVLITYKKESGEISERVVHPYGLVSKNMFWYLVGYCCKSSMVKTFKCVRITKITPLNEQFDYPSDFLLQEYWENSLKEFKNDTIINEMQINLINE